jgi:hypothetical protein
MSAISTLIKNGFDLEYLRPYKKEDGKVYVKDLPVEDEENYSTYFTEKDWVEIDGFVHSFVQSEMSLYNDLIESKLNINISEGIAKKHYQYTSNNGSIIKIPLPVTHKDMIGNPLNKELLACSVREVSNAVEKFLLNGFGCSDCRCNNSCDDYRTENRSDFFDNGICPASNVEVKGILNHPGRFFYHHYNDGINFEEIMLFVEGINKRLHNMASKGFDKSFNMYIPPYMSELFNVKRVDLGDKSVEDLLLENKNIKSIIMLPNIPKDQFVFVEMDRRTIEVIVGVEPIVVQWSCDERAFKCMTVIVPKINVNELGQTGILHGYLILGLFDS